MSKIITDSDFQLDERLNKSCFILANWPLSLVLLKNNACYPWMILVPRRSNITELTELLPYEREQLIHEMHHATHIMQAHFKPEKMNTATLGNIVSQLHIHIVARFKHDRAWPHSIWQSNLEDMPYAQPEALILPLKNACENCITPARDPSNGYAV